MDTIDYAISFVLMGNSRIPYRELAEMFNMSTNSIHNRIKKLVERGIITKFRARFSGRILPFINVVMFGTSNAKNQEALLSNLGENPFIYNVTQAGNNLIFLHARIRNLGELDELVAFTRQVGEIDDLTIGLDANSPISENKELESSLTKRDYYIINALKENSRKLVSEIAEEIKTSSKTVRRHLNQLIEKGYVNFSIDLYPDKSGVISSLIILKIRAGLDKNTLIQDLREQHGSKIMFTWIFSNLPDTILVFVLANAIRELQELERTLTSEKYDSVTVTLPFKGEMFPTWQDQYLEDKLREFQKSKK